MKPRPYSWMHPSLAVRDTGRYGYGVFANDTIPAGELLIACGGSILTIDDENHLPPERNALPIGISEWHSIGPRTAAEIPLMPQHYVNHSCEPNAGWKGQIFLMAMRDIQAGEEITYDYAMVMHSNPQSSTYWTLDCRCGSPVCRHVIAEDDWLKPELQARYDGWFNWHLQQKVDTLRNAGGGTIAEVRSGKAGWMELGGQAPVGATVSKGRDGLVCNNLDPEGKSCGRIRWSRHENGGRRSRRPFAGSSRLGDRWPLRRNCRCGCHQSFLRSQPRNHRSDFSRHHSRHPTGRGNLFRLRHVPRAFAGRSALPHPLPMRLADLPGFRYRQRLGNYGTPKALRRLVQLVFAADDKSNKQPICSKIS